MRTRWCERESRGRPGGFAEVIERKLAECVRRAIAARTQALEAVEASAEPRQEGHLTLDAAP